jgi:pimeloyl-ACP methyl ester carboxylesterase
VGNNILYGATPPNYNGKTILFTHGFIGSTESLLIGNSMYKEAYTAGYKTAFVATSRLKGDWENGEILSRAIDQVGNHLNTNTMTIIAHSNGGKAADVALLEYQKINKINKVITLGTPHWGTQIADFANYPGLEWITGALGLGTGSQLSTTYYCETYFRPYMDSHPLNQPQKFYSLGAWGFSRPLGLLSPVIIPAGTTIAALGGGKNDGVTPFYSSTRPGAKQLMTDTDPRGYINHVDIMEGIYVWDEAIKPVLDGQVVNTGVSGRTTQSENKELKAVSNYQLVSSEEPESLQLSKDAKNVQFEIITKNSNASVDITDPMTGKAFRQIRPEIKDNRNAENHLLSSNYTLENRPIKLNSNSEFIAVVQDGIDNPMEYKVVKENGKTYLEISFPKLTSDDLDKVVLKSSAYRVSGLKGEGVKEKSVNVKFNLQDNKFLADVSNEESGVYSIKLNAQIGNGIKRALLNGFVVSTVGNDVNKTVESVKKDLVFALDGNPVIESSKLVSGTELRGNVSVKIYNYASKLMNEYTVKAKGERNIELGKYTKGLGKGNYVVIVDYNNTKESIKFIKD